MPQQERERLPVELGAQLLNVLVTYIYICVLIITLLNLDEVADAVSPEARGQHRHGG